MATIRYRVHTTCDPLSSEGVILFTRGRRPNMLDYEAFADRIGEENDVIVHAIYENWHPSLTEAPKFEGSDHKMLREAAVARNANHRFRHQCLYRIGHVFDSVANYMETLVHAQKRGLLDMENTLNDVRQRGRLHTWDAPMAQQVGSFVESSQVNYTNYLGYLAREEAELSFQLATIGALAEETTREHPCCDKRSFIVEFGENSWETVKVFCGHCGTEVKFSREESIPDIPQEAVEEAA